MKTDRQRVFTASRVGDAWKKQIVEELMFVSEDT
jgi:hypothetical protein